MAQTAYLNNNAFVDFNKLRERIKDEQFQYFQSQLHDNMRRNDYVCLFLNTFLGKHLCIMPSYAEFSKRAHALIDRISLLGPEIDFFHKLVDLELSKTYTDDLIKIYREIQDLNNCSLGQNIIRCLEASKNLIQ